MGGSEKSPTYDFIQCQASQSGTGQIKHYQNTVMYVLYMHTKCFRTSCIKFIRNLSNPVLYNFL